MEKTGVNRVNYFPRQVLRTEDFVDEQAYHLEARRRHNIGHHVWGIVSGLELKPDKDGAAFVTPGFAIDGFGRELVLPAGRTIPPSAFDETLSNSLDIWALYSRTAGDRGDPAYQPCVRPIERREPYRLLEIAAVEWRKAVDGLQLDPQLGVPEGRQPPDVSVNDLKFDPTRVAPDDPRARWPVFLGRIDRVRTGDETTFVIEMDGRPYAGARAEAISTPTGNGWLQIGRACDNPFRFALFLKDQGQVPVGLQPRLALDHEDRWQIRGSAAVRGDVALEGGAVQFGAGLEPDQPKPWRMYRVRFDNGSDELRIEIPKHSESSRNQMSVGVFADGKFKECLTIADDCTVTVKGDLIVKGGIQDTQSIQKAVLSDQAKAIAASVFTGGLMQSLNLVIGGQAGGARFAFVEAAMRADPEGVVDAMAEHFRQRPELLKRLRDAVEAPPEPPRGAAPRSGEKGAARKRGTPAKDDEGDGNPEA